MPRLFPVFTLALLVSATSPLLRAADFRPNLGPDLPRITVTCGDVTVLLRQASQWTPGRFDYRGHAMTTEKSSYGTVFMFPEVGFIGTGHLENEPEELRSLAFFVNGKEIPEPVANLLGARFRFERVSRIREFTLSNTIKVENNRIYESAVVRAAKAVPLKLVYHFMHAWRPSATAYLAGVDGGEESGGVFRNEEEAKGFLVNREVDWVAVYDGPSETFAVSRLLEKPAQGGAMAKLWNVPGTYRKFYLQCFSNETVPAGFAGTWRMVTGFGKGEEGEWKAKAKGLAEELAEKASSVPLSLDGGKKWQTDEHTRSSIRRIAALVESKAPAELGQALSGEINRLFAGCKLEGEAHNQLHIFLSELLAHVNGLYSAEDSESRKEEVAAITKLLAIYGEFFE